MNKQTQIQNELWRRGDIDFILRPEQHKIREALNKQTGKIRVALASRRLGKTFGLLTDASKLCIKKPNAIVKYICPKQNQGERNLKEDMRDLLATCPPELRPVWHGKDKCYRFPNGSEIQVAGTDNGNHENLRGGSADMCIVDEAGFCDHLGYVVRSVLRPTILHTGGCVYLVSTPSRSSNHEFITEFVNPLRSENKLEVLDIHTSTVLSEQDIEGIAHDYPMGKEDPEFIREYLCRISDDIDIQVIPEVSTETVNDLIITDYKLPDFYDYYVSGDIGFKDLTAFLFGYWDFKEGTLVIIDELIIHGPSLRNQSLTQVLADGVKEKKALLFGEKEATLQVMDNDLVTISDLNATHGLTFMPTAKDNKDAAVNMLRLLINSNGLKVHERCKHLLYHLQFAEWDEKSNNLKARKFKHLPDSPDKTVKGGHADALDSLIYMNRNVIKSKNPYPTNYGVPSGDDVFMSPKTQNKLQEAHEGFQKIMNIDPRKAQKKREERRDRNFRKKFGLGPRR